MYEVCLEILNTWDLYYINARISITTIFLKCYKSEWNAFNLSGVTLQVRLGLYFPHRELSRGLCVGTTV